MSKSSSTSLPSMLSSSSSSWIPVPEDSDFTIHNLPLGVFSVHSNTHNKPPLSTWCHCATRIGDTIIDLSILQEAGLLQDIVDLDARTFTSSTTLNAFLEHSPAVWQAVRSKLQALFSANGKHRALIQDNAALIQAALYDVHNNNVCMHLPIQVQNYTDFYASREHATNVGTMFRGKDNALQPNWLHLPVGYHGRASTVVISGTPIIRPCGQLACDPKDLTQGSIYGPTRRLDFELEVAAIVGGRSNALGQAMTLAQAKERIFGFVLMNDWSARDIQAWEYVPLGPFTSKNFATSISPWIIMRQALEPDFVVETSAGFQQDQPAPLPYLHDPQYSSYNVQLMVDLQVPVSTINSSESSANNNNKNYKNTTITTTISRSNLRHVYWNAAQQLVHHSVTGCILQAGDVLGSGTVSGNTPDSYGSMLELSWNGTRPLTIPPSDNSNNPTTMARTFLHDGDTVILRGVAETKYKRIGFGECVGTILPAVPLRDDDVTETRSATAATGMTVTHSVSPESATRVPSLSTSSLIAMQNPFSAVVLYGYWRSSSTWRVRIALAAKQIKYETISIDLATGAQHEPSFLAKNPLGQVPFLECTHEATGQVVQVSQSMAIMEFLDLSFPSRRSLLPSNAMDKVVALQMVEIINSGTQPLQNRPFINQLEAASDGKIVGTDIAKEVIAKGLKALEMLVVRHRAIVTDTERGSRTGGPYCLTTFSPSIVDAYLVPQMYNARLFGVAVDEVCPTLVQIDHYCSNHPWFRVSHPDQQPDAPCQVST